MFDELLEQIQRVDEGKAPNVYWSNKTDDPYYDSLIRNPGKAQKKKLDVRVEKMSPEEYLELAFKFDYSSKAAFIEDAYPKTIKYLKNLMLDPTGQEIDLPFIDFAKEEQEGRHRAIAAVELGVAEIPVLIIKRKQSNV